LWLLQAKNMRTAFGVIEGNTYLRQGFFGKVSLMLTVVSKLYRMRLTAYP
jgi:hypothetical protein